MSDDVLPEGVYSNKFSFVLLIKASVASLCDATASFRTEFSVQLTDPNGNVIQDDFKTETFRNFVLAIDVLYQYTQEFLDAGLSKKIKDYLDNTTVGSVSDKEIVESGILISEEFQKEMYDLGLKDTAQTIEMFDFELYRTITGENKVKNGLPSIPKSGEEFDPLNPNVEIIGFSGRSEFAFMYTNFSNRSFFLLSEGKFDEERNFFYGILVGFAPVFDLIFLDNCIAINNRLLNTTGPDDKPKKLSKKDYHNAYLLHKAEFSRLMMRAGIHQQPDIMDNKQPDYIPAQKPAGL
ncbi:hypothetical protein MsAg5_13150 [Methanosarcinaceae archaeon Ag5]|uniref:Uncharacterized protein n=2 Tax=Methanolapillus africanus TaxID=3028297 RepID=A0AAE4MKE4_9EURY|nr:hypothetical protein [Methanosarcinaceae archaeon Ag5]